MARRLKVRHVTRYSYANAVQFGPHRMLFRPRDSHDMRLLATGLSITPTPIAIRWIYDVFGNSVAIADFNGVSASELTFVSEVALENFEISGPPAYPDALGRQFPVMYPANELDDLAPFMRRHSIDPGGVVVAWARQFVLPDAEPLTILSRMMSGIKAGFAYRIRVEKGTRSAIETLALRQGTCRDFALLMMEGARSLGFAARFVTGYVFSPGLRGTEEVRLGGGATHAWAQVYLPGSGWVEFDPTNAIFGNRDLIRVAVARDPSQAVPLTGSWVGARGDYLGMTVEVEVTETPTNL